MPEALGACCAPLEFHCVLSAGIAWAALPASGQIILSANRIINAKAPDIRLQGEKILVDATNRVDIISKGFFQLKYGFSLAAAHGDMDFGVLTQTLKKDILATPTTLGDE